MTWNHGKTRDYNPVMMITNRGRKIFILYSRCPCVFWSALRWRSLRTFWQTQATCNNCVILRLRTREEELKKKKKMKTLSRNGFAIGCSCSVANRWLESGPTLRGLFIRSLIWVSVRRDHSRMGMITISLLLPSCFSLSIVYARVLL